MQHPKADCELFAVGAAQAIYRRSWCAQRVLLEGPTLEFAIAIITTDSLGRKDIVQHDRTGIRTASKDTLSPADASKRLHGDGRSRKHFGEKARHCSGKADGRDVSANPANSPAIHRGFRG